MELESERSPFLSYAYMEHVSTVKARKRIQQQQGQGQGHRADMANCLPLGDGGDGGSDGKRAGEGGGTPLQVTRLSVTLTYWK